MPALTIQHLLRDHRHIEEILDRLESLLDSKHGSAGWGAAESSALEVLTGALFREQCRHMRKENEVFFPFLEDYLPKDSGPLAVLREEHADLAEALQKVRQAGDSLLKGSNVAQATRDLERFGSRTIQGFRDHIYKEDRVLFPMIARFMTSEKDLELVRRFETIQCAG